MTEARINALLDEALRQRAAGDLAAALLAIQPLLKITAHKASVAGILGTLFFEDEQWPQAAHWFRQATKLNPDVEHASLGLFHALWEMERRREALSEMARFRASHLSPEYNRLHREMTEEFLAYMAYMNGASPAAARGKPSGLAPKWRTTKRPKLKEAGASAR